MFLAHDNMTYVNQQNSLIQVKTQEKIKMWARLAALAVTAFMGFIIYRAYDDQQQQQREGGHRGSGSGSGGSTRPKRPSRAPPQPHINCPICQSEFASPLEILPCHHIYHRACIREWFKMRMICPYCNTAIPADLVADYTQRLGI